VTEERRSIRRNGRVKDGGVRFFRTLLDHDDAAEVNFHDAGPPCTA